MSEIHLLKINYNDKDFSFIQDIRKSVFKDELQISEAELFDDFDNDLTYYKDLFANHLNKKMIFYIKIKTP